MEFLKKWKLELPYDPEIPLLGIYLEKNENTNLKRHMHLSGHRNTIDNGQAMETVQLSVNRGLD